MVRGPTAFVDYAGNLVEFKVEPGGRELRVGCWAEKRKRPAGSLDILASRPFFQRHAIELGIDCHDREFSGQVFARDVGKAVLLVEAMRR